jgi:uncharacterized protein (TIGR02001 family)
MGTKIKAISLFVCAAALLAWPGGVRADSLIPDDAIPGEFGGYVGFGTEYNWRGISQTDEEPSVQGEIDYSVGVSEAITFYVSVWGSNVDFGDSDGASLEIDYFGGFSGEVPGAAGLGWDIGGIGYTYPGSDSDPSYDFAEAYGGLSYDFGVASAAAYVHYTPDFFAETDSAVYFFGDVGIPLPKGLTLGGHEWKISLTVALLGFDLEFAYIDTDIDSGECFGDASFDKLCDERFYFFASRSF